MLIQLAPGKHLVRIHLMATCYRGNGRSGFEGFAHYREFLLDGAAPALFRLGQNLNGFYIGARLKHRRKTTSKFKRYLVSGFRRGRPTRTIDLRSFKRLIWKRLTLSAIVGRFFIWRKRNWPEPKRSGRPPFDRLARELLICS
jgi:hypothetical protein